ncbi:hypothetical protein SAMN04488503_1317 [Humidesulfovibrio mexicanus]|jgi:hypothetical protein|uniref:TIGR03943 family protein n=1 Tax=Humidesulfovibrio mexicanus TaxID=147047 RepID=A0A238Z9E7_9BACT|nr:hypothetical protein [Humidesulfovibrio mexicanus]SNR79334.1 hypothetical protein SAMN04488503_1317 [Humidesulfovibrio mexicanus]
MSQASKLALFRSAFRQSLQDRVDGLCLLCMGGFIAALSRSSLYWYFLNPRFSGLTFGAGALLCLCGLALVLRPTPGPSTPARLWRQAVLLAFLSLGAMAWEQAAREPFGSGDSGEAPATLSAPMPAPEEEAPADPSPVLDGERYTRLNLAELYIMLDKGRKDYPPRFALRAQVLRSSGLDAHGHVLLRRVAVVCCLADSLDLRFLVRGADGESLDGLRDGDWVEVFGSLEPLHGADKHLADKAPKGGDGPGLAITNPGFRILARRVDLVSTPPFPYVFEFREKPPFAW